MQNLKSMDVGEIYNLKIMNVRGILLANHEVCASGVFWMRAPINLSDFINIYYHFFLFFFLRVNMFQASSPSCNSSSVWTKRLNNEIWPFYLISTSTGSSWTDDYFITNVFRSGRFPVDFGSTYTFMRVSIIFRNHFRCLKVDETWYVW